MGGEKKKKHNREAERIVRKFAEKNMRGVERERERVQLVFPTGSDKTETETLTSRQTDLLVKLLMFLKSCLKFTTLLALTFNLDTNICKRTNPLCQ